MLWGQQEHPQQFLLSLPALCCHMASPAVPKLASYLGCMGDAILSSMWKWNSVVGPGGKGTSCCNSSQAAKYIRLAMSTCIASHSSPWWLTRGKTPWRGFSMYPGRLKGRLSKTVEVGEGVWWLSILRWMPQSHLEWAEGAVMWIGQYKLILSPVPTSICLCMTLMLLVLYLV